MENCKHCGADHTLLGRTVSCFNAQVKRVQDDSNQLLEETLVILEELEQLKLEAIELKKDKVRLDYLETHKFSILPVWNDHKVFRTDGSNLYDRAWELAGWSVGNRVDELPTIREAIDASINE